MFMGDQLTDWACALHSATIHLGKLGRSRLAVPKQPALLPLCPTLPTSLSPTLQSDNGFPVPFSFRVRPFGLFLPLHTTNDRFWASFGAHPGNPALPSALRPTHLGSDRAYPALDFLDRPGVRLRSLIVLSLGPRVTKRPAWGWESEGCPGFQLPWWPPPRQSLSTAIRGAPGDKRDVHPSRVFALERDGSPHTRAPRPSGLTGSRGLQRPRHQVT